jgi:hypothetical protein
MYSLTDISYADNLMKCGTTLQTYSEDFSMLRSQILEANGGKTFNCGTLNLVSTEEYT